MQTLPISYQPLDAQDVEAQIQRSWARSKRAGLEPNRDPGPYVAAPGELRRRRTNLKPLLDVVEKSFLPKYEQAIRTTKSRIMLCDATGTILEAWGDEGFLSTAQQVCLEPGNNWQEESRGTNAIGTALAEGRPALVLSENHYLSALHHVSCAASPITNGQGQIAAVLDISGHHSDFKQHKVHLAQMISLEMENLLLCQRYAHLDQVQCSNLPNCPAGALLFFDSGSLVAANRVAIFAFNLRLPFTDYTQEALFPEFRPQSYPHNPQLTLSLCGYVMVRFVPGRAPVTRAVMPPPGDPKVFQAQRRGILAVNEGIPLLVQGETGTGKEVLVRHIHQGSGRAQGAMVALNCAALPDALAESELFGHLPGSFTGASSKGRQGKIREAEGGILFLDEIGELSLAVQAKLLRALQEKQVTPLGGTTPVSVDFALVAATHKDLEAEVRAKRFREDLFFRLSGVEVCLPALRHRQDFDALVDELIQSYGPGKKIGPELRCRLAGYDWPGNLRQLDQALHIACVFGGDEEEILFHHLPERLQRLLDGRGADAASGELAEQEDRILLEAYRRNQGNVSRTARTLGISRNKLYRRLKRMNLVEEA